VLAVGVPAAGIAVVAWLVLHMLRQNGRLLVRLEAVEKKLAIDPAAPVLPVGTQAQDFQLPGLDGRTVTIETLHERGTTEVLKDERNGRLFPVNAPSTEIASYIANTSHDTDRYVSLATASYREYRTRLNWRVAGETLAACVQAARR
jgi:hypothetical protein